MNNEHPNNITKIVFDCITHEVTVYRKETWNLGRLNKTLTSEKNAISGFSGWSGFNFYFMKDGRVMEYNDGEPLSVNCYPRECKNLKTIIRSKVIGKNDWFNECDNIPVQVKSKR